uniref:AlNc14C106G6220 protein n=1 Tax=Albugo laibachii Nc14 TaxID=890382 RepID=F0WI13_9STRA|nr:AlNc14C106G6220 [Albugo laibachii Nc14]|eukprot:CCA20890.1 AlNc14C106G6220 [Albugo laibachii Nc14]
MWKYIIAFLCTALLTDAFGDNNPAQYDNAAVEQTLQNKVDPSVQTHAMHAPSLWFSKEFSGISLNDGSLLRHPSFLTRVKKFVKEHFPPDFYRNAPEEGDMETYMKGLLQSTRQYMERRFPGFPFDRFLGMFHSEKQPFVVKTLYTMHLIFLSYLIGLKQEH